MEDNNILIAEFMGGYRYSRDENFIIFNETDNIFSDDIILYKNLMFDKKWDWLMLVVERINGFNNVVSINENHVFITNNEKGEILVDIVASSMFEAIYEAIVKYVKYYNEYLKK